jgi:hypothetical protein
MRRMKGKAALAGLIALALGVGALGPCLCQFSTHTCDCAAEQPDARSCCQTPTGVVAVADGCCEASSVLAMTASEVPEVGPPVLRSVLPGPVPPDGELQPVAPVRHLPPLPLDRTTVLLI